MALELPRRRFTVSEYYQMAQAGILTEDDRVELIDGEIVEMSPIGPRHAASVKRLARLLERTFGDVALISVQDPVHLSQYAEPQPDLMVLRPRPDFYATRHPIPRDILLLIEVADTSIGVDRRLKVPLYARAGIAEVWLVDLQDQSVTAYWDPTEDGYRIAQTFRHDEQLAPAVFPDREIAVDDILA